MALVLCVLATQWTAVLQSSSSLLLQVFNGTRCPHVPHSTCSCHLVALHLFDQGTLLRRLAPYCMCSTVCALAPCGNISDQQHCTVSPVLLTSCGSLEVDATGSVSAFLYTLCGLWRRCVFFQHARSVQFQIKLLLSLRLQLEYNHVKLNYNCTTLTVSLMACYCVHNIYENRTKFNKLKHICPCKNYFAFCSAVQLWH